MGIGESLKNAISVTTRSWGAILVFFVYGALTNLANAKLAGRMQSVTAGMNPVFLSGVLATILFVAVGVYFQAGLVGYVRDQFEGKKKLSSFWGYGAKYYLKFFLLAFMIVLLIGVLYLFGAYLLTILRDNLRPVALTVITLVALGAFYFVILLLFAPYAIVCDGLSLGQAIGKSMELSKKNLPAIFILGLCLVAIGFVGGLILGVILGMVGVLIPGAATSQPVITILSSVVNALVAVLMTASYMSLYKRANGTPVSL